MTPRTEEELKQAEFAGKLAVGMTRVRWLWTSRACYPDVLDLLEAYKHETPEIIANPNAACWGVYLKPNVELDEQCDAVGCHRETVDRIFVNIWGVLYECDVCDQHRSCHGTWRDSL